MTLTDDDVRAFAVVVRTLQRVAHVKSGASLTVWVGGHGMLSWSRHATIDFEAGEDVGEKLREAVATVTENDGVIVGTPSEEES